MIWYTLLLYFLLCIYLSHFLKKYSTRANIIYHWYCLYLYIIDIVCIIYTKVNWITFNKTCCCHISSRCSCSSFHTILQDWSSTNNKCSIPAWKHYMYIQIGIPWYPNWVNTLWSGIETHCNFTGKRLLSPFIFFLLIKHVAVRTLW